MIRSEIADLLAVISAFDRRTVGAADVEAWNLVIGDLPADDCAEAVRQHFTESTDWLMPAHVRKLALAAKRHREGIAARAKLDAEIAAENNGDSDPKAITAGGPAPEVWAEAQRQIALARAERQQREAAEEAERQAHIAARKSALSHTTGATG